VFLKLLPKYNKSKSAKPPIPDSELLERYRQSQDSAIVGELFERYTHLVFGVCMKYLKSEDDSKDAVMQIFEKLLEDLKIQQITYFKTWLYTVTRNHCLMILRKNRLVDFDEHNFEKKQPLFMESDSTFHLFEEEDSQRNIANLQIAINKLKTEQRVCVELFYLKEKSYNDIVELTNYDMNKVKSYIQNGKRNLKILLEQING